MLQYIDLTFHLAFLPEKSFHLIKQITQCHHNIVMNKRSEKIHSEVQLKIVEKSISAKYCTGPI